MTITGDVTLTALWEDDTRVATETTPDDSDRPADEPPVQDEPPVVAVDIAGDGVPLIGTAGMHWALANLILAILALASALIAVLVFMRRRAAATMDGDSGSTTASPVFMVCALICAVIGAGLFLLTENMALSMALLDSWTVFNALLFVGALVFTLVAAFRRTDSEERDAQ
jgi:hypothetical protein